MLAGIAAVAVGLRDAGNIEVAEAVAWKVIEAASTAGDAAIFAQCEARTVHDRFGAAITAHHIHDDAHK